jgi:hypothetical protein
MEGPRRVTGPTSKVCGVGVVGVVTVGVQVSFVYRWSRYEHVA